MILSFLYRIVLGRLYLAGITKETAVLDHGRYFGRDIFFPTRDRMFIHVHRIVLSEPLVHIKAIHEQGKTDGTRA